MSLLPQEPNPFRPENRPLILRPAWMTGSPENDWPEDAPLENGNYFCDCVCCSVNFIGHKRRHVCKKCDTAARESWAALKKGES